MKINTRILIFYMIILRPTISFCSGYINILGTLSLAFLDLTIIAYLFKEKVNLRIWITITMSVLLFIIAAIQSENISIVLRDGSKFTSIIIILSLCTHESFLRSFRIFVLEKISLVKVQIFILYTILFIQTFDDSKYTVMYGEKMFTSNLAHSHTLAYLVLLVIIVICSIPELIKSKVIYYILIIESLYLLVLSSARLALIAGIMSIIMFNRDIILISISSLLSCVYIKVKGIESISFFNKFLKAKEYGSISSGRNILWEIDVKHFKNSGFMKKILGNGIDFPYNLHLKEYGEAIWSHNDFFNILIANGILGLVIYVYSLIYYVVYITKSKGTIDKIFVSVFLVIIAFGNGLYSYTDFIIALIFIAINQKYNCKK